MQIRRRRRRQRSSGLLRGAVGRPRHSSMLDQHRRLAVPFRVKRTSVSHPGSPVHCWSCPNPVDPTSDCHWGRGLDKGEGEFVGQGEGRVLHTFAALLQRGGGGLSCLINFVVVDFAAGNFAEAPGIRGKFHGQFEMRNVPREIHCPPPPRVRRVHSNKTIVQWPLPRSPSHRTVQPGPGLEQGWI